MGLVISTAPTFEPFTLQEAKDHLRVDNDDENVMISLYMAAARKYAEAYTGRTIPQCTYTWTFDKFPSNGLIEFPAPPLISVTSVQYIDTDGATQTWSSGNYYVDATSEPGRLTPAYGVSFPTTKARINAVSIVYVAGYASLSAIPENVKLACLQFLGHAYENRQSIIIGSIQSKLLQAGEMLLTDRMLAF